MTRKDLSKCKLWWGESRKWAFVCGLAGWQLDESIPTNCFNYFSLLPNLPTFFLSSRPPNLFHHPPFCLQGQFTFGAGSHGARFLFVVCKDRSSWLFTNSSGIKSVSLPGWPLSIHVQGRHQSVFTNLIDAVNKFAEIKQERHGLYSWWPWIKHRKATKVDLSWKIGDVT